MNKISSLAKTPFHILRAGTIVYARRYCCVFALSNAPVSAGQPSLLEALDRHPRIFYGRESRNADRSSQVAIPIPRLALHQRNLCIAYYKWVIYGCFFLSRLHVLPTRMVDPPTSPHAYIPACGTGINSPVKPSNARGASRTETVGYSTPFFNMEICYHLPPPKTGTVTVWTKSKTGLARHGSPRLQNG